MGENQPEPELLSAPVQRPGYVRRQWIEVLVYWRYVRLRLIMRPRKWRSWRHHHLALGAGYFLLSYSKLEQEFVTHAGRLALARAEAHSGSNPQAENEAHFQAMSIRFDEYRKAAMWAGQAKQMTTDPKKRLKIDQIVTEAGKLSAERQAIAHSSGFFGEKKKYSGLQLTSRLING